ncbi:MAG: hypothetical protein IKX99_05495 [Lachnospiraceae bacterium]|nr:hypothetical protein [Lachnospiraceae bacterium]
MKRFKVISLMLVIILVFLTACGNNQANNTSTPVVADNNTDENNDNQNSETSDDEDTEGDLDFLSEPLAPRYRYGGTWDFLPQEPVDIPTLSEMKYVAPDEEAILASFDAFLNKIPEYTDILSLMKDYNEMVAIPYDNFKTMYCLAYLRYSYDMKDAFYSKEYKSLAEESFNINDKLNILIAALAESPFRDELEEKYFDGSFKYYEGYTGASEKYLALLNQEQKLTNEYFALTTEHGYSDYDGIADIFLKLIKVRHEIAVACGYDNYLEYAYVESYGKDYNVEQARDFLKYIKDYIYPIRGILAGENVPDFSDKDIITMLGESAKEMGGLIWDSYRYLRKYELYQFGNNSNSMDASYEMYLTDYEVPVIFLGYKRFKSLSHEFGHFTDELYNYGAFADYDTSEVSSQTMAFLTVCYSPSITEDAKAKYQKGMIAEAINDIIYYAADTTFEMNIYTADPENLTVSDIEDIYYKAHISYGLGAIKKDWVYRNHFIDYALYMINYATSAMAAVQIMRTECENKGAGVDGFIHFINRKQGIGFTTILKEAGLANPFEEETFVKTAEFLQDFFKK